MRATMRLPPRACGRLRLRVPLATLYRSLPSLRAREPSMNPTVPAGGFHPLSDLLPLLRDVCGTWPPPHSSASLLTFASPHRIRWCLHTACRNPRADATCFSTPAAGAALLRVPPLPPLLPPPPPHGARRRRLPRAAEGPTAQSVDAAADRPPAHGSRGVAHTCRAVRLAPCCAGMAYAAPARMPRRGMPRKRLASCRCHGHGAWAWGMAI